MCVCVLLGLDKSQDLAAIARSSGSTAEGIVATDIALTTNDSSNGATPEGSCVDAQLAGRVINV